MNNLADFSQGPNAPIADGHVEQFVNWDQITNDLPDSEDLFSFTYSPG